MLINEHDLARDVALAEVGTRNATLFRSLCIAIRNGLPTDGILRAAIYNNLSAKEVTQTLKSAQETATVRRPPYQEYTAPPPEDWQNIIEAIIRHHKAITVPEPLRNRNISIATCQAANVCSTPRINTPYGSIPPGCLIPAIFQEHIWYAIIRPTSKTYPKQIRFPSPEPRAQMLFTIPDYRHNIAIMCEGELDALALHSALFHRPVNIYATGGAERARVRRNINSYPHKKNFGPT